MKGADDAVLEPSDVRPDVVLPVAKVGQQRLVFDKVADRVLDEFTRTVYGRLRGKPPLGHDDRHKVGRLRMLSVRSDVLACGRSSALLRTCDERRKDAHRGPAYDIRGVLSQSPQQGMVVYLLWDVEATGVHDEVEEHFDAGRVAANGNVGLEVGDDALVGIMC